MMEAKALVLAACFCVSVLAQPASTPERPDIPLKGGAVVPRARITGVESDRIVVISGGEARTIHKSEIDEGYAKTIDWPPLSNPAPSPANITNKTPIPKPSLATTYQQSTPSPPKIPPAPSIKEDFSPFNPFPGEKHSTLIPRKLRGQCFVVTRGGQNYKLGDVKVRIFPKAEYDFYLSQVLDRYKAFSQPWEPRREALEKAQDYRGLAEISTRGVDYIHTLQDLMPETVAEFTDADGKFEITHNIEDPFLVVAKAHRLVGDETEKYEWNIESKDIPASGQLMLSNRNMKN
jgi:hypothetical protein